MKNLINVISTTFILLLSIISAILPRKIRGYFGKFLGYIIMIVAPSRKKITIDNLNHAFPRKSQDWIAKTTKDCFYNLGIVFAEMFSFIFISKKSIYNYTQVENAEFAKSIINQNKGVIFLSAHFGNWELLALSLALHLNIKPTIIVKPQSNHQLDKVLNKMRVRFGNKIVSAYNSAFEIVRCIQNKEILAILADQSASEDKDVYVQFFGRPTATYKAPAQLALRFRVPILIPFMIRQKDFTYRTKIIELKYDDLENSKQGVLEFTQRYSNILESQISQYPEHWVWQHRRWKHILEITDEEKN
ncbi:MAG: lysophospholipid acyltransferase family protein [Chloroherpetonaceae bacterium]